jgi:hypothetical protein
MRNRMLIDYANFFKTSHLEISESIIKLRGNIFLIVFSFILHALNLAKIKVTINKFIFFFVQTRHIFIFRGDTLINYKIIDFETIILKCLKMLKMGQKFG